MLEARISRHDVDDGSARDLGGLRAADGAERISTPLIPMVTVRYFAAAAEAAGVTTETLPAGSVGDLVASMVRSHGQGLQNVLAWCSLLAAGVRVSDDATLLADGVTVDVLPPFAGG